MHRIGALIAGIAGIVFAVAASAADIDWNTVDQALGKPGTNQPGGVRKYGLPRSDLKVTVDGVNIRPTFALGSWIAFLSMGNGAMFMGDLVLTENEISPVMKRLIDDGVEITAIHNHLLRTSRRSSTCMSAVGRPRETRANAARGVGIESNLAPPAPAQSPPTIDLDTGAIDTALGQRQHQRWGLSIQSGFKVAQPHDR